MIENQSNMMESSGTNLKELKELKDVLTVTDVKNILGIGKSQAYNLCNEEKFHTVRVGNRIIVSSKSFHNWLHGEEN